MAALFRLNRDRSERAESALWFPTVWLAIGASRNVSLWFGAAPQFDSPDQYLEGSPVDRAVLATLIVAGLIVVLRRRAIVWPMLRRNWSLVLFLSFAALSATWSEFPYVALKRWTKALGNFVAVVIIASDRNPATAVRLLFARVAFVLIPASVLLIKYYPAYGRYYDRWLGHPFYTGVSTDKNGLGCTCLVLGLASVWRLLDLRRDRAFHTGTMLAHGLTLMMVGWLLYMANSATAVACFGLGAGLLLALTRTPASGQKGAHLVALVTVVLVAIASLCFSNVAAVLDRDVTLTGRTELWERLLAMNQSPWLGSGFETFFLGPRLERLAEIYWWRPNQAHNGYLEIYLTLGTVGLVLLAVLCCVGYRTAVRTYEHDTGLGALQLCFLAVALVYNWTEAGFKVMNPMWIVFMFAVSPALVRESTSQIRNAMSSENCLAPHARAVARRPASRKERVAAGLALKRTRVQH